MTTPTPPGGNTGLLGGASGSLGGTNVLQASLDRLTNAVTNLGGRLGNLGGSTLGGNGSGQSSGGTFGGFARFPKMVNPFRLNNVQSGGIGGAGGPNTGNANITPTPTFGQMGANVSGPMLMLNSMAQFGQNMMMNQLSLNQYATMSMMGMNRNGMGYNQSMQALYRQVGATPGYGNGLAFSPQDAYAMAAPLQQLGGSRMFMQQSLGRAGLGAAAGFGISNPSLGAQTSAQLAAALYSPSFSSNMLRLGYNPIRSMTPGGAPMNAGMAAKSILQGLGIGGMNPTRTYGNLMSPRGQAALQALFGPSGIPNDVGAQFLQTYAQLFSKGYSASAATNLIQKASFGPLSQRKTALSQLGHAGVSTATSDITALKNAQSVITGRQGEYAGGFNDSINQSTDLLNQFNTALNKLLNGPLGTAAGYAGGTAGVLGGAAHGAGLGLGIGGAMSVTRLLGLGGRLGGENASLFARGGTAGLAGEAGAGGLAAVGAAIGAAAGMTMVETFAAHIGSALGSHVPGVSKLQHSHSLLGKGVRQGLSNMASQIPILGPAISLLTGHNASMGGGASAAVSKQQKGNNNHQVGGGVSGAAKKAVGAAETQLGVPYVYGDEIPGVGFDCSGLVQWAYGQAGIHLPRTSQSMWTALKGRRIPLSQVQEGDLLFTAGSDGTASSPGHVAMMVSHNQLIQAPYTGTDVQLTGYNPHDWVAAARPSGSGSFISGGAGNGPSVSGTGTGSSSLFAGNRGASIGSSGGNYGSAEEVDIIAGMGYGGHGMGNVFAGTSNGSSGSANKNTGAPSGGSTSIPGGKNGMVAIARKIAAKYGWDKGQQWQDFIKLENMEAGWSLTAHNPSGAYGVAQLINGPSEYYQYGGNPNTAVGQFTAMFNYIKQRYPKGPVEAWAHEMSHNPHWYGGGGTLGPGMSIVGERGPELAINSGGKTHIFSNAQTNYLLNSIKGNVAQSPWKTDVTSGAHNGSAHSGNININFKPGSIVIHSQGAKDNIASKAGREVARQIVHHVTREAISQAIRNGDKL